MKAFINKFFTKLNEYDPVEAKHTIILYALMMVVFFVPMIMLLMHDPNQEVRLELASNLNTSPEIIEQLLNDESLAVRGAAIKNPNIPLKNLTEHSKSKDWRIRRDVAGNPNTPIEVRALLANDKKLEVRLELARNRNNPSEILTLLFEYENSVTSENRIRNWFVSILQKVKDIVSFTFLYKIKEESV